MIGLRHVLAPPPVWLQPRRVALVAIAAIVAATTPPIALVVPESARWIDGSPLAMLFVVAVTTSLSVALAGLALRSASTLHARAWLALGGAAAGALAVAVAYMGVMQMRGWSPLGPSREGLLWEVAGAAAFGGGPLGFLYGTAYAPMVVAAMRAEAAPSHDGIDRVLLAGGAVLFAAVAVGTQVLPSAGSGPWSWAALVSSGVAGFLTAGTAALRMVQRVRLLARVRDGEEPGFHVVPRSGKEDEVPLVPLVRGPSAAGEPGGVLAATGISAPYRGARGIFKLALAPLPGGPALRPVVDLAWAGATVVSHAMLTLMLGGLVLVVLSPILLIAVAVSSM